MKIWNENSMKCVPGSQIDKKSLFASPNGLVQMGAKPLNKPMMM